MDIETKRAKTIILLKPSENIQFSSSTNMPSNIYWRWINWRQKALIHLRHGWLLNTVCTNPYHMAFAERWGLVWTKFRRNWLTWILRLGKLSSTYSIHWELPSAEKCYCKHMCQGDWRSSIRPVGPAVPEIWHWCWEDLLRVFLICKQYQGYNHGKATQR